MPNSMTGFGQASVSGKGLSADVIVRSVNGKHLKTRIRLDPPMPGVEERIKGLVTHAMQRGTVEVSVRIDWTGAGGVAFNERIIGSYVRELRRLGKELGVPAEPDLCRIAALPGAMVPDAVPSQAADRIWRKLKRAVQEAIDKTVRMRASEGRMLARGLRKNSTRMRALLKDIEGGLDKGLDAYRRRLRRRVRSLTEQAGVELQPGDLARETILFSEKSDISEELCRMRAHVAHFADALKQDGTGRKLEFIAQEMHREANTMASKASDPQTIERIIDLRGEVDQVREQVANLE
jgi:uncharacterized protein (TIGR00255 family)